LKERRENARKCIGWANHAFDVGAQSNYFEMAKAWLNLAEHLERAHDREHDKQAQVELKRVAGGL
jgi:hypothetical protein